MKTVSKKQINLLLKISQINHPMSRFLRRNLRNRLHYSLASKSADTDKIRDLLQTLPIYCNITLPQIRTKPIPVSMCWGQNIGYHYLLKTNINIYEETYKDWMSLYNTV